VQLEPLVDSTTIAFVRAMEERFVDKKTCDLGEQLHFFVFDVLGEHIFSKRLGFVKQGWTSTKLSIVPGVYGILGSGRFPLSHILSFVRG
jgi:hypothetical protein